MCVFNRKPPSPPPLPKPRPTAPKPEVRAKRVNVGQQRSTQRKRGLTRGRSRTVGTSSLQIPLLNENQMGSGNLNY